VQSSTLPGSETWPITKENEVALQRLKMKMFKWMCVIKLRERLRLDDIISVLQQNRLQWACAVKRRQ